MPLLTFSSRLAQALIKANNPSPMTLPVGRPTKHFSPLDIQDTNKRGKAPKTALPDVDWSFASSPHWLEYREKRINAGAE